MRRVISTGGLLLALSAAAWGASGCEDNGSGIADAGFNVIENLPPPPDADIPDAERPWVNDNIFPPEDADTTDAAADAAAEDASQP